MAVGLVVSGLVVSGLVGGGSVVEVDPGRVVGVGPVVTVVVLASGRVGGGPVGVGGSAPGPM